MKAKRVDSNQKEIVKAFRDMGCSVFVTSHVGQGFPDIVVGIRGKTYLFELKDGNKSECYQKLTNAEKEFSDSWKGQYHIINSVDQVIHFVNNMT